MDHVPAQRPAAQPALRGRRAGQPVQQGRGAAGGRQGGNKACGGTARDSPAGDWRAPGLAVGASRVPDSCSRRRTSAPCQPHPPSPHRWPPPRRRWSPSRCRAAWPTSAASSTWWSSGWSRRRRAAPRACASPAPSPGRCAAALAAAGWLAQGFDGGEKGWILAAVRCCPAASAGKHAQLSCSHHPALPRPARRPSTASAASWCCARRGTC